MSSKSHSVAENPLILRCHRIMEAFAKSDDERDFYLDRQEGFLIYLDLDKTQQELDDLTIELKAHPERYCPIPKLTFYEIKKVMEGFVNEKIYDIDTKEKLLDIISSKEARENFLEFIYDHHSELEKWQQYYQERFRVRIIEWLRNNQFDFVFEEDLELTKSMVERLKMNLFTSKVGKDIAAQRKALQAKAKTYYSSEALNPRPKRGRPPKQVVKVETEPQFSQDIYTAIPKMVKPFLFAPDYHGASAIFTFSGKFASEEDLLAHRRQQLTTTPSLDLQNLQQKLAALRTISGGWSVSQREPHMASDEGDRRQDASVWQEPEQLNGEPMDKVSAKKKKPAVAVKAKKVPLPPVSKAKVKALKPVAKPVAKPVVKPVVKLANKISKKTPPRSKVAPLARTKPKPKAKAPAPTKNSRVKLVVKKKVPTKVPSKTPSQARVPVRAAKPVSKSRLRPIAKPVKSAVVKKQAAPAKSSKGADLRLLRRAGKKR